MLPDQVNQAPANLTEQAMPAAASSTTTVETGPLPETFFPLIELAYEQTIAKENETTRQIKAAREQEAQAGTVAKREIREAREKALTYDPKRFTLVEGLLMRAMDHYYTEVLDRKAAELLSDWHQLSAQQIVTEVMREFYLTLLSQPIFADKDVKGVEKETLIDVITAVHETVTQYVIEEENNTPENMADASQAGASTLMTREEEVLHGILRYEEKVSKARDKAVVGEADIAALEKKKAFKQSIEGRVTERFMRDFVIYPLNKMHHQAPEERRKAAFLTLETIQVIRDRLDEELDELTKLVEHFAPEKIKPKNLDAERQRIFKEKFQVLEAGLHAENNKQQALKDLIKEARAFLLEVRKPQIEKTKHISETKIVAFFQGLPASERQVYVDLFQAGNNDGLHLAALANQVILPLNYVTPEKGNTLLHYAAFLFKKSEGNAIDADFYFQLCSQLVRYTGFLSKQNQAKQTPFIFAGINESTASDLEKNFIAEVTHLQNAYVAEMQERPNYTPQQAEEAFAAMRVRNYALAAALFGPYVPPEEQQVFRDAEEGYWKNVILQTVSQVQFRIYDALFTRLLKVSNNSLELRRDVNQDLLRERPAWSTLPSAAMQIDPDPHTKVFPFLENAFKTDIATLSKQALVDFSLRVDLEVIDRKLRNNLLATFKREIQKLRNLTFPQSNEKQKSFGLSGLLRKSEDNQSEQEKINAILPLVTKKRQEAHDEDKKLRLMLIKKTATLNERFEMAQSRRTLARENTLRHLEKNKAKLKKLRSTSSTPLHIEEWQSTSLFSQQTPSSRYLQKIAERRSTVVRPTSVASRAEETLLPLSEATRALWDVRVPQTLVDASNGDTFLHIAARHKDVLGARLCRIHGASWHVENNAREKPNQVVELGTEEDFDSDRFNVETFKMAVEFSIRQGSRLQEMAREFSQEDESNLAKMKERSFRRRTSSSLSLSDSILSSPVTPTGLSQEEFRQEKAAREMVNGLYQSVNETLQSSPPATLTPVLFSLSEAQVQAYERSIRTLRDALEEAIANHDDKKLYQVVEKMIHETPDRQLKRFRREKLLEALRKDFEREVRGNEFAWFDNRSEDGLALMAHANAGATNAGPAGAASQGEVEQLRSDVATFRREIGRLEAQMARVLGAIPQAQDSSIPLNSEAPGETHESVTAPKESSETHSVSGVSGMPSGQKEAESAATNPADSNQASTDQNSRCTTKIEPELGYAKTFTPSQKGKASASAEPATPSGAGSSQTNKRQVLLV